MDYTVAYELSQRILVEMLQLAAAAAREVTARRIGVVRSRLHAAIGQDSVARSRQRDMAARRGDTIALGGNANNLFCFAHRQAA